MANTAPGDVVSLASDQTLLFFCPGCEEYHGVAVNGTKNTLTGGSWHWDGNAQKPTLIPSVHVVGRCHSFVRDGMIQFLDDCTHKLARQTVPLPVWESFSSRYGA